MAEDIVCLEGECPSPTACVSNRANCCPIASPRGGEPLLYSSALTNVAFTDTTIVWNFAAVTVALMAVPNQFGILLVRKEVKALVSAYLQSR